MTGWILDTLVWTGALIALALVVRRPLAARFGPRAAYALWLLPFARMVLPPIELPAWLAPAVEPAAAFSTAALTGALKDKLAVKHVGLMICGTNIDAESHAKYLQRAAAK